VRSRPRLPLIFSEALVHGSTPWTAPTERRALLYKYAPGHMSWGPAWATDELRAVLTDEQRAKLMETRKGAGSGSRLSRSPGRINMAEVYRAVEAVEPFATPSRKPNAACPVGHCIRETLDKVFASAQAALERDLEKTTLASVICAVKASGGCAQKRAS